MTESETDDKVQPPVVTGETMIPPTEVNYSVDERDGLVTLHQTSDNRSISHMLMLEPETARIISTLLEMKADKIEQPWND